MPDDGDGGPVTSTASGGVIGVTSIAGGMPPIPDGWVYDPHTGLWGPPPP
jgi:hypothetical protein